MAVGRELDYKRMIARALTQLGEVARLEANVAEARALFEQTLSTWRAIGHKSGLVDALRGLGDTARLEGNFSVAEPLLEESLSVCRDIGARRGIAAALESLGNLAAACGNRVRAKRQYSEALTLWNEMEDTHGVARCIESAAELIAVEGRFDVAAMLLGGSEALREQIGAVIPPADEPGHHRVVATVRDALGESVFLAKWEEGRKLGRRTAAWGLEQISS